MIEVKVGDEVVQFPDDATPQEIEAALAQSHPIQSKDPLGLNRPGPTVKAAGALKAQQMGPLRRSLYGAERSLDEAAMGAKQLVAGLSPEDESGLAVRRAAEQEIPGSWVSRMLGDAALYAAPSVKAVNLASKLRAGSTVAKYGAAAGTGAAVGGLQPVLGSETRSQNAGAGALFGALGQGVGDVAGQAVSGFVQKNPSIATLPAKIRDKLTLGQTADRNTLMGKFISSTEERLQSVPFTGNMIRDAREGAANAWRDDLTNRVAPKGMSVVGDNTRDKLDSIYNEYQTRYGRALAGHQIPPSQLFESQVANITNNPRSGLTSQQQSEMRDMVMNYYRSMFHGNSPFTGPPGSALVTQGGHRGTPISIDASNAKGFEAFLTNKASQYRRSNAPGASDMAKAFEDLERAWSVSYRRQLPSSARQSIRELDRGYAPYVTVERAAGYTGNDFGNFTPQQLVQAVRARTPVRKFARGGGILQDEAQVARDVLIDRTPNSGTADRAMTFGALAGMVTNPMETVLTMGGAVPLLTSKTGRNLMTGDTKTQQILKRALVDRMLKAGGAPAGVSFADLSSPEYTE